MAKKVPSTRKLVTVMVGTVAIALPAMILVYKAVTG
jgi:hypothetical protein